MINVGIDFESYYGKDLSLSKVSTPEYVHSPLFKVHMMGIKIDDGPTQIIEPENLQATFDWLKTQEVNLIAHNCLFDGYIASRLYGYVPQRYSDTAAMARGDNPQKSASLKNTCIRLWPNDKTKRKGEELAKSYGIRNLNLVNGLFSAIAGYCQQDNDLCIDVYHELLPRIPDNEMDMIDLLTRMFCDPVFEADIELLEKSLGYLLTQRDAIIKASGTNEETLSSDVKYKAFLKSKGIEIPYKISPTTKMKTSAFAKNDLEYLRVQRENPDHENIFAARTAAKSRIDITRTERFLTIAELTGGIMPVLLKYSAAHTHRLGGGDKTNMQNLPRNAKDTHPAGDLRPGVLRRALLAPKGKVVLVRDLSQIEARVLACIAGQEDLVDDFRNGVDIYCGMASRIYKQPVNKDDNPFERGVGKVSILGLGYQMGGPKFKDTMQAGPMGMPPIFFEDESLYDHIVYNVYRATYRNIVQFWKICERFINHMINTREDADPLIYLCLKIYKDRIELPNGLSLLYPNIRRTEDGTMYDGKNGPSFIYGGKLTENIVQALAQIVIKMCMLESARQLPTWRVALQVHDEIALVGDESDVERADKVVEKIMATPPSWMPDLPLASEGGWAENYSK